MINELDKKTALVIPAYDPDDKLLDLVISLNNAGFKNIIVVNDGSEDRRIFKEIERDLSATILEHSSNRGKGAALKTGFNYAIEHFDETLQSVITVDADGQHLPKDVIRIAEASIKAPGDLILGVRKFSSDVPLRSRLGNTITRYVLNAVNDIDLDDTQTGLRAIPIKLAQQFLDIPANHYEFELECILAAKKSRTSISQVPISTVYIEDNQSSHFRPLIDSMKIYFIFGRFLLNSVSSFLVDILAFSILYGLTLNIYTSTYTARAISASVNFLINKYFVFKSSGAEGFHYEALGYGVLALVIATLSAYFVSLLNEHTTLQILKIKILVDVSLFCFSFLSQRILFSKSKSKPVL
jgi:glycosyltransferase involved in cell wall biosynthesis